MGGKHHVARLPLPLDLAEGAIVILTSDAGLRERLEARRAEHQARPHPLTNGRGWRPGAPLSLLLAGSGPAGTLFTKAREGGSGGAQLTITSCK